MNFICNSCPFFLLSISLLLDIPSLLSVPPTPFLLLFGLTFLTASSLFLSLSFLFSLPQHRPWWEWRITVWQRECLSDLCDPLLWKPAFVLLLLMVLVPPAFPVAEEVVGGGDPASARAGRWPAWGEGTSSAVPFLHPQHSQGHKARHLSRLSLAFGALEKVHVWGLVASFYFSVHCP